METMYDFEVACKNCVIDYVEKKHGAIINIKDVHVVWMCKTLGNKKAIMIASGINKRIYELTYNGETKELYFDVYEKTDNEFLKEFKTTVDNVEG